MIQVFSISLIKLVVVFFCYATQVIGRAASARRATFKDAIGYQRVYIAQGGVSRALGDFGVFGGCKGAVKAVKQPGNGLDLALISWQGIK